MYIGISTHIHADGYNTKPTVVGNKGFVLFETMVLDKSGTDDMNKVPIETSIDETDQDFRYAIPVFVDMDDSLRRSVLFVIHNREQIRRTSDTGVGPCEQESKCRKLRY